MPSATSGVCTLGVLELDQGSPEDLLERLLVTFSTGLTTLRAESPIRSARRSILIGPPFHKLPVAAEVFLPTFVNALVQIYTNSPFAFGVADICCIDAQHMIQIAASFYVVMGSIRDNENRAVVRGVLIVLPPSEFSTNANADSIRAAVSVAVQRRLGTPLSPEDLNRALGRLRFVQSDDLSVGSAVRALGSAGNHEAALLLHAGAYREESCNDRNTPAGTPILPEDQWPRHLQFLASHAIELAKQAETTRCSQPAFHRQFKREIMTC
jgi:hypothetical protein